MEKEVATFKVKELDLCLKCDGELKTISLGGSDFLGLSGTGKGAFYCENKDCDFFGIITIGVKMKHEKIEATK